MRRIQDDQTSPVLPLLSAFQMTTEHSGVFHPAIDTGKTEASLAGSGLTGPVLTGESFHWYLDPFVGTG